MRSVRIAGAVLIGLTLILSVACATPKYHLSTAVNGQGNIIPESGDFLADRSVTVLAVPASGWLFDHWEGALSGNNSLASIVMSSDKMITAIFSEIPPTVPTHFTTYTNRRYDFSISVPNSWLISPLADVEPNESGSVFVAPSLCSGFPVAGAVSVNETPGLKLESYYETVKNDTGDMENISIISEEEITVNGIAAMKAVCTGSSEGVTLQMVAYVLVAGHKGWDIEMACAPECWEAFEGTFNTVLNSFQVLD